MHKMMTTQTPGARGPRVRFGTGLKKCGSPKPGAAALYRISSVRAAAPPPVFLKETRLTIWGPGEPRRRFCILLSLRAETRTKGCGRAFDVLFRRTAFFMRGHTATKVWPEGHLLSSHEERRQRRAKGVPPLGIPKQLAGFLFRKAGGRADARTRRYTKKGCGPGLGWL